MNHAPCLPAATTRPSAQPGPRPSIRPLALKAVASLVFSLAALQPVHAMPGDRHGGLDGGPGGALMSHHPRQLDRMLDSVQATPDQRMQLQQIFAAARADLKAQREQGRALREQARVLWTQPTVDARAAESLRQQMQAQQEAASKRRLQAMLEASRVLTPAQRQQLVERAAERAARWERAERGERRLHPSGHRGEGGRADAPR
jgi:Spy/CpxP family protein refolding chaperone